MAGSTLDIEDIIEVDADARQIANKWVAWDTARLPTLERWKEVRDYVFATDTRSTTNKKLPWKNTTTTPKLCQIMDNIHANYMATLFPTDRWLSYIAEDDNASETVGKTSKNKKDIIESYMLNKTELSGFRTTVSQLSLDYITYGNAFATTEYVNESYVDPETGEEYLGYTGPRIVRISPYDIVFNPVATSFENSPKIIRILKSLGELKKEMDNPNSGYLKEAFKRAIKNRASVSGHLSNGDHIKTQSFIVDGFGSYTEYLESDYVELLQFHGDYYDINSDTLYKNHIITVMDRTIVLEKKQNPSWRVNSSIRHVGWRQRPDNLWAQGPLENLVGLQYRIDHLENLKADAFDMIAFPMVKIRGIVEDFEFFPGERILCPDGDSDVTFLHPDTTALNADIQIERLELRMEELAGAPKQAMGIRTPGEKTKYEVQTLENASGRIFQNKVSYFEENFKEKLLNDMLELARRSLDGHDLIRVFDNSYDVDLFLNITKEDLIAKGRIKPIGARHFARRANMVQNLHNFANSALGQDPSVTNHISGLGLAKLIEELLDIERFSLVSENIRIEEAANSQRLSNGFQEDLETEQAMPLV